MGKYEVAKRIAEGWRREVTRCADEASKFGISQEHRELYRSLAASARRLARTCSIEARVIRQEVSWDAAISNG